MSFEVTSAATSTQAAATTLTKGAGLDIAVDGLRICTVGGRGRPGRVVLSDVCLHVAGGTALAIVGPSGAGKTTLVKALIGEVSEGLRVVSGSIAIAGVNPLLLRGRALRAFRRRCAYVDQDPGSALPPRWSVRRIIRQRAALSSRFRGTMRDSEILDLLEAFGLTDIDGILERTPGELSGGQRRRLGIAAGIAGRPELLLIDEPTAGVDKAAAQVMLDSLKIAREQSGATCVIITHDMEVAKELADCVMRVSDAAADDNAADDVASNYATADARLDHTTTPPNSCSDDAIVLKVANLTLHHGTEQVLTDFNLSVRRGEILGIAGPSGCGKTTLLRAILGLHPVAGGEITISTPDSIGWIPQESELSLNPAVPIATTLRRAASRGRRVEGGNSIDVSSVLGALDLPDSLRAPQHASRQRDVNLQSKSQRELDNRTHHRLTWPDQLSGGQRQRVNVARALLSRPTLLLADEPTSALDQVNAARVIEALRDGAAQRATVIVSHDPAVLAACDRVIELAPAVSKPA